jgi:hypothetical protein
MRPSRFFFSPYSLILVGLLTIPCLGSSILPTNAASVTLATLQPKVVTSIDITQINTNLVSANFKIELANARKPANVWMVNTLIVPNADPTETISIGVSISISNPITFDSWSNESGILTSGGLERLEIQNVTASFPHETIELRLWVGSNYSIDDPVVTTSVPTYQVTEHSTDYTNKSIPSTYSGVGYLPELFNSSRHVVAYDIFLSHSGGFQTFADFAYDTPFIIMAIAVILVAFVAKRPVKTGSTDYIQGLLTLLLFVPLFSLGIDQLVPQGNSVFLQQWLGSVAYWTSVSFAVVATFTFVAILRQLVRREPKLPHSVELT